MRILAAGLAVAALVVTGSPGTPGSASAQPLRDGAAQASATPPTLRSVGIANRAPINVNADARGAHRPLRVRAVVAGSGGAGVSVRVHLAQFDRRGGRPTSQPSFTVQPVEVAPVRRSGSVTDYEAVVPWSKLRSAAASIPAGQSMLLCIWKVEAFSRGRELMRSPQVRGAASGQTCAQLHHRPGDTHGTNSLLTGVLGDVQMRRKSSKVFLATYSADSFSYFRDRPERVSRSIAFADLAKRERWKRVFADMAPRVEVVLTGSARSATAILHRPEVLAADRYRSRVRFVGTDRFTAAQADGRDWSVFANPIPAAVPDPQNCLKVDDGFVPDGADFIGDLRNTVVTARPGRGYLTLESDQPVFLSWFLSRGTGCGADYTASMPPTMPGKKQWRELFGDINPNSALLWRDGATTRVLEFEQSRPRVNRATGRWSARIRPLSDNVMPSRASTGVFIEDFGRRLEVESARIFMDSTNSVQYGGEYWVVDNNFQIRYFVQAQTQRMFLTFTMLNNNSGWMGLTFHEFMFPGDSIVAWWQGGASGGGQCLDLYNPGIPTLSNFPSPLQDTNPVLKYPGGSPYDNVDNVQVGESSNGGGTVSITCQRQLLTQDIFDFQIYPDQLFHVVAAYNTKSGWDDQYNAQQPEHTAYGADVWGF